MNASKMSPVLISVSDLPGSGKCYNATSVILSQDGRQIAHAKLGGKYSPEQAMKEFKKNPGRFTKLPACPVDLNILAQVC